jgi:phytoene desaturase
MLPHRRGPPLSVLARDGIPVTIFERESIVGDRASTVHAPGRYKFDIGPTFFLYPRVLEDILEAWANSLRIMSNSGALIREITEGILSEEPSVYIQHADAADPSLALKGHTSLYVLVPVPNLRCGIDWQREAPRYRKRALERLKLLGLHDYDIEKRIRFERVVTPRGWQDEFSVFEGATFNLARNLTQMLYFRPHNRFGGNVSLVGGGTHPGSGLPVIYEGARITTQLRWKTSRHRAGLPEQKPDATPVSEAAL